MLHQKHEVEKKSSEFFDLRLVIRPGGEEDLRSKSSTSDRFPGTGRKNSFSIYSKTINVEQIYTKGME